MTTQTRTLTIGLGILLMMSHANAIRPFNNVLDVFCWLGYILAIATIVLWPKTGKDESAKPNDKSPVWAEKIDFDRMGR